MAHKTHERGIDLKTLRTRAQKLFKAIIGKPDETKKKKSPGNQKKLIELFDLAKKNKLSWAQLEIDLSQAKSDVKRFFCKSRSKKTEINIKNKTKRNAKRSAGTRTLHTFDHLAGNPVTSESLRNERDISSAGPTVEKESRQAKRA